MVSAAFLAFPAVLLASGCLGPGVVRQGGGAGETGEGRQKEDVTLSRRITLEFVDQPLGECCRYLTGLGIDVSCDEALAGAVVTLRLTKTPGRSVLRLMARLAGAKVYRQANGSLLISNQAGAGIELPGDEDPAADWPRVFAERLHSKKVNFEFVQAPLSEVIDFFQSVADLGMVMDPAAKAGKDGEKTVTLKGEGMTLGEALDRILDQAGLRREYRDGAIFITGK